MLTETVWMAPVGALLLGYLLGSIPFGLLLTRAFGAGDLRQIGSGSIGATNVLRTGHKGLAAATLLLDLAKGYVAVVLARHLFPGDELLAAAAVFIGHCYPVWLKFRGGKGVATLMGIVLAIHWPCGLVFAVVWLGLLASLRISSVAGIAAAFSAGSPPSSSLGSVTFSPTCSGCSSKLRRSPFWIWATKLVPEVESSSSPSLECTTQAFVARLASRAAATGSTHCCE